MPDPENEDFAAVTAAAIQKAQGDERKRITAINGAEGAQLHPKLAQALIDNNVSADVATTYLAAALEGTNAAVAAAKPQETQPQREEKHVQKKTQAGALGLGSPETTDKPSASAGWGKAVSNANRRVG
ncbi:hypothetical protein [Mesorhizobium sp. ANAO-SY3R2]|uniref:hypothetical protein n=1 Tax=Mesorhizobium sp. ANAO-SY3R2 TaxID=3166644 RepID=UPI00366BE386